jgi:short-subunit dehydrogenase
MSAAANARPIVLITGGSEGIGYELAKRFARDRHDLVLVARDADKLRSAAEELSALGARVEVIVHDLSPPGSGAALHAEVHRRGLRIDVLVNNAGAGLYGPFAETGLDRDLALMRLNMEALVALTRLVLPGMLERRSGAILNVGSTAGFQPGPLMAVYYATKAFVLSFSEALANELEGSGVQVSVLCPGPTLTGFQRVAGIGSGRPMHAGVMTAVEVADIGYREFRRGELTIIPGLRNRLLAFAVRLAPRRLVPRLVRRLQEKRAGR